MYLDSLLSIISEYKVNKLCLYLSQSSLSPPFPSSLTLSSILSLFPFLQHPNNHTIPLLFPIFLFLHFSLQPHSSSFLLTTSEPHPLLSPLPQPLACLHRLVTARPEVLCPPISSPSLPSLSQTQYLTAICFSSQLALLFLLLLQFSSVLGFSQSHLIRLVWGSIFLFFVFLSYSSIVIL